MDRLGVRKRRTSRTTATGVPPRATREQALHFTVRSIAHVAAYMTSGGNPGSSSLGDPESVHLVPAGQYLTSYTFYADPTYDETSLVIVRALNANGKFDDGGKFEFRRVDLIRAAGPGEGFAGGRCTSGLQRMDSAGPFTATIWGWGITASYAYPGGMAQRKLVSIPLIVR